MKRHKVDFSELVGKIITEIKVAEDLIIFVCDDGTTYSQFHIDDCCESVEVDDIEGDINDLLNTPILSAEETTNSEDNFGRCFWDSFTWTFYKIATIRGYVTIKWLGVSNGYYSESVTFAKDE